MGRGPVGRPLLNAGERTTGLVVVDVLASGAQAAPAEVALAQRVADARVAAVLAAL